MTVSILLKVRAKRRTVTRKLALELWAVGLASAILLAIALLWNGPTASSAQSVGAWSVGGGRLAGPTNPELKAFMERVALTPASSLSPVAAAAAINPPSGAATEPANVSTLSRAAIALRASEPKARATQVAAAVLPPPRPALATVEPAGPTAPALSMPQPPVQQTATLGAGPWQLVHDTGATALANIFSVGDSLGSLAKKFQL